MPWTAADAVLKKSGDKGKAIRIANSKMYGKGGCVKKMQDGGMVKVGRSIPVMKPMMPAGPFQGNALAKAAGSAKQGMMRMKRSR